MFQLSRLLTFTRNYSFKSVYSLETLYPKSKTQLCTPTFVPEDPNTKFTGYIPVEKMTITYSRSSGPGGQHVNKTNTKVDLRFNVKEASWLSDEIKELLLVNEKNRINREGFLIMKSDITRYQHLNLADALEKLRAIIRKSVGIEKAKPSEETIEVLRKRAMKASRQRIFEKRRRSEIKQSRRVDFPSD